MASNIFQSLDYSSIIQRIDSLQPDSPKRWGKMDIIQMLEHCAIQLRLALGIIPQTNTEGSSLMRTKFGRWVSLYALPWSKGLPTPQKMNMVANNISVDDFQAKKEALLDLLGMVIVKQDFRPHPFFGKLDKKYWGRLIWKHIDHHLKQFGA